MCEITSFAVRYAVVADERALVGVGIAKTGGVLCGRAVIKVR
jgi:hypothetical protein